MVSRWSEGGLKGVRSELEGSQGHPKGVQMMSDEGSTGGKHSLDLKVKGNSGFGLPTAPSQEVRMRFEWSERNWPNGLKATRTVLEVVEVVSDLDCDTKPVRLISNESK